MQTKVLKVNTDKPDSSAITKAVELLDAGGLVAFPTETVYGIGCRAETESLTKLDKVKERKNQKRYTVHIGKKDDVKNFVPEIGLRSDKLIRKAWPGPLTIVFELSEQQLERQRAKLGVSVFDCVYEDSSIGLRCPDNRIASAILKSYRSVLVAPSANITGQDPATNADEVLAQLDGRIDLVLDGGPCRYKKSSTVVKLGKTAWQMLREGVYSKRDVEQMWRVNILFVCTGNTCRSPMAQGFCRKYLAEKLDCNVDGLDKMGYKVSSAGVMAPVGMPAGREAIAFCKRARVDISACKTQPISSQLVEESDYIFVMCRSHRQYITENWPDAAQKCQLLAENAEIDDPIGQGKDVYEKIGQLINDALKKRISELVL